MVELRERHGRGHKERLACLRAFSSAFLERQQWTFIDPCPPFSLHPFGLIKVKPYLNTAGRKTNVESNCASLLKTKNILIKVFLIGVYELSKK